MNGVSIKGIILACLITVLLDAVGAISGVFLFSDAITEEAILALEVQTGFLIFAALVGLFTTALGGYICAIFGKLAPYKNAAIFGVIGIAICGMVATFEPVWFDILGLIAVFPASLFGGHLAVLKMHNKALKQGRA